MKTFIQFLTEMPLPKDMEQDSLTPAPGRYSNIKASMALRKQGATKIGEGSSRIAYQIKVEKSQFKSKKMLSNLDVVEDMVNTVIKLAINSKGIAQNDEEIKVFKKFKSNPLLLPIIDTSVNHRVNILLANKDGKKMKTTSNWIQMPVAEQWKSHNEFAKDFEAFFGDLLGALRRKHHNTYKGDNYEDSTSTMEMSKLYYLQMLSDDYGDPAEENIEEFINEEQMKNLRYLLQLANAGLNIYDLNRLENWGKYRGKMVILDYGFNRKTTALYSGRKSATADVDEQGNIILTYENTGERW